MFTIRNVYTGNTWVVEAANEEELETYFSEHNMDSENYEVFPEWEEFA